jgi:tetratricopeptide (TPR) repeat protein
MSTTSYTCSHCDHRFELESDAEKRCPACLRSHGLLAVDGEQPSAPDDSFRTKVLVALTLVAAVALIFALQSSNDAVSPEGKAQDSQGTTAQSSVKPLELNEERLDVTRVSEALKSAVLELGDPVQALRDAGQKNLLPARSIELPDALGVPRASEVYLGAFKGKLVPNIGRFEWMILAGRMLKAKTGTDVAYGFDKKSSSRCVIEHRVYAIQDATGTWHSQDDAPIDASQVQVMSQSELRANALAWHAMASAGIGELDQASMAIGEARKLSDKDQAISFTEGRIQLASELPDKGFSTMELAASRQGDDAQAFATIGELALGQSAPFRATGAFQKALTIDPNFSAALLGLAQVDMGRYTVTPESDKIKLKASINARLSKVEASGKKDSDLRSVQADLAGLEGDDAKRKEVLELNMTENPRSLLATLNLVQYHMEKQNLEEAIAAALKGESAGVRDPRLATQLGVLHFEKVGQALASQGEAGLALHSKEAIEGALKFLKMAKTLAPEQKDTRLLLSQAYHLSGDKARSRAMLTEQSELFPKDTDGLLISAQLALQSADYPEAKKQLERVFTIDAKSREAAGIGYLLAIVSEGDVLAARKRALGLGYTHLLLGQSVVESVRMDVRGLKEVVSLMDAALVVEPESIDARNLKAVTLTLLGQEDAAIKVVSDAVALVPEGEQEGLRKALEAQRAQAKLALQMQEVIEEKRQLDAPPADEKTP